MKDEKIKKMQGYVNQFYDWREAGNKKELDDLDAVIWWDEHINGKRCFDYDRDRNYRMGLRQQAGLLLHTYTRIPISIGGKSTSIATVIKDRREGAVPGRLMRASSVNPSTFADSYIQGLKASIKAQVLRLRQLEIHPVAIHNAIIEAEEEANATFEEFEKRKKRKVMEAAD